MKKVIFLLTAAVAVCTADIAAAQVYFQFDDGYRRRPSYQEREYYQERPYRPRYYRDEYDAPRRYAPPRQSGPARSDGLFRDRSGGVGCIQRGYTVQDGVCKPYRGF